MSNYQICAIEIILYLCPLENKADDELEFILDEAKERLGVDYLKLLIDMLEENGVDVVANGAYCSVNITIKCLTVADVSSTIEKASTIIKKWANKYNIHKLKEVKKYINKGN